MSVQTTTINTPGSNTYTIPATVVPGTISVTIYGAMGDGERFDPNGKPIPYQGPVTTPPWPGVTTTGGKSGRIDASLAANPGQTLTVWIGDASGHGYHAGGAGSAGSGGTGLGAPQPGFHGGGSSAILTTTATPTLLVEAAGGGGASGAAYSTNDVSGLTGIFGSAHGGNGGKVFGAGYNGSVTPHTPACFGGGGGGGGGFQGVGAAGLNTHTGHGATVAGGGGDSGVNQAGYACGGGGGAGGTSYATSAINVGAKFSDAAGTTTLGAASFTAHLTDPPLAPTLTGPYNGIFIDCTKPLNFSWTYNKAPDSGTQQSYSLRVALDGGAYQYWNASSQQFQPTQIWNTSGGTTISVPANAIANNHAVSWSVATAENYYGVQGPFAPDRTFPSGTTIKWQLVDPVTNEAYAFAINPNTGGSLTRQKNVSQYATTADDSVVVLYEGADQPQPVQISGTLLTQAQYAAMVYWYSKRRQVLLIDDLGRNIWVYFIHFDPQRKWTVQSPWRHDWTAQFYVIGPQAVSTQ